MELQSEFNFEAAEAEDGYSQWIVVRHQVAQEVGDKLGLPLGHQVEVWLRGGIRLRGRLQLAQELLLVEDQKIRRLPLVVDGVSFSYGEIESCVRTD